MREEKRSLIHTLITAAVIGCLFLGGGFWLISALLHDQRKQTEEYLLEVAEQSKNTVEAQIAGDFQTLKGMAGFVGAEETIEIDKLMDILLKENKRNIFQRLGFVYPDGSSYIVDINDEMYKGVDFSDRDYVKQALAGNEYLSGTLVDRLGAGYINCYSVPVYHKDKLIGALCAVLKTEVLREIIESPTFGNRGFVQIVTQDGDYIVRSIHENSNTNSLNLFDYKINSKYKESDIRKNMKLRKRGIFAVDDPRGERYVTYAPLNVNNWYLVCAVPKADVNRNFKNMLRYSTSAVILVIILFVAFYLRIRIIENRNKKQMKTLAYYDNVTGCFNKNMFIKIGEKYIHQSDCSFAIICIDVNNFKYINELFGFKEGDILLKYIVSVLDEQLREGEIYSRMVADKFLMLLKYQQMEELTVRLGTIMDAISNFSVRNNRAYRIISSAGINALSADENVGDIELMIDHANIALSQAKGKHVNSFAIYNEELHKKEVIDRELENIMIEALKNEEFVVYLQPKFQLSTEKIVGAEALVRWNSPTRGLVPPNSFIPLFERNGFVNELDMYVLNKVCETLNKWKNLDYDLFTISVNQSRMHLYEMDYIEKIKRVIHKNGIQAELIMLEVTENVALDNTDGIKQIMTTLQELGFSVSMDDFGSGYSSLNILKDLPFNELKLDRIFLQDTHEQERGEVIIGKIIELSKCLNMKTVTEGVETETQAAFLKNVGCDIAQGYYYARPMPIEEFERLAFAGK